MATSQDDSLFDPLHKLLEIKKWGILQKKQSGQHRWVGRLVIGKYKDKTTKSIYCQEKANPQIYKTWYKKLSLGNA